MCSEKVGAGGVSLDERGGEPQVDVSTSFLELTNRIREIEWDGWVEKEGGAS